MKRFLTVALMLLLMNVPAFAQQSSPPIIPFESVPNALKLPYGMYMGEASGVAVNSKGHVFVFSRGNSSGPAYAATAAQLLEFDQNGNYVREIGKNLYAWAFAHTGRVDRQDNIWAADKGSDMVVKFTPNGRVAMVFGRKQEASDEGTGPLKHPKPPLPPEDGRFRQVTDMAFDTVGNTYISDGYINSRIAKVGRDGKWLTSWGTPGNGPGQFNTPHSIAADVNGHIYVADRGNRRIQVFDDNGTFIRQITIDVPVPPNAQMVLGDKAKVDDPDGDNYRRCSSPRAPWVVCVSPPPHQFLYTADAYPGRIYKFTLDGRLLVGTAPPANNSNGWIHGMACPSENVLYVAEILNWRVQKLILHPNSVK